MRNSTTQSMATIGRWLQRIAVLLPAALFAVPAWSEPAAVKISSASLMNPTAAAAWFLSQDTTESHTNGLGNTQRPQEIQELARALGKGRYSAAAYTENVFQYVYSNIRTEFRFGLSKGAIGALIDQSGTPFDQAQLMVEILREGGVAAGYQVGEITLDAAHFTSWTGIISAAGACQLLADGGIPAEINGQGTIANCGYSGSISTVGMTQIWVVANNQVYDPSYKAQVISAGINLASALGCGAGCGATASALAMTNTTQGTSPAPYVQNVNTTLLNGRLSTYAQNLQSYIQTNNRFARLQDIIGGSDIDLTAMPTSFATLPYGSPTTIFRSWPAAVAVSAAMDIPNAYRTTLTIQLDSLTKLLYADESYGAEVIFGFVTESDGTRSAGLTLGCMIDGRFNSVNEGVSSGANPSTTAQVIYTINHPYYAPANGSTTLGTYMDDTLTQPVKFPYANAVLILGLGDAGPGLISQTEKLRSEAANAVASGPLYASIPTIYTMAANWLTQITRANRIVGQINGAVLHNHHSLGYINAPFDESYFAFNVESGISVVQTANNPALQASAAFAATAAMSGLEGGVPEQLYESWDGGSSVTLFGLANEKQHRFYDADATTIAAIFAAAPSPGYVTAQQTAIANYLNGTQFSYRAIVPDNGEIGTFEEPAGSGQTSTWQTMPFVAYSTGGERFAYISGYLTKGSGTVTPGDPSVALEQSIDAVGPTKPDPMNFSVDLATAGALVTMPPDIVTGNGSFPASLPFQRTYNSSDVDSVGLSQGSCSDFICSGYIARQGILPLGWSHTYELWARMSSDGTKGLGLDTALDASAAIASLYTLSDLFSGTPGFQQRLTGIFVANWFVKQLDGNVVVVHQPSGNSTFVRLPDMVTFNSPLGSSDTLTRPGSQPTRASFVGLPFLYSSDMRVHLQDTKGADIQFELGDTYTFLNQNFYKNLFRPTHWTFPNGIHVDFTYITEAIGANTRRKLSTVTNNLGRKLSMSYTSPNLATSGYQTYFSVTDENSRKVQFQYGVDADGTEGHKIIGTSGETALEKYSPGSIGSILPDELSYVYSSMYKASSSRTRLTRIYQPTDLVNPFITIDYGPLLRVWDKKDALGNVTSYFSSGLFNENLRRADSVSALGEMETDYFDLNAQLLQKIDPLNRVTNYVHDTAAWLTKTIYPEGNSTENGYDVRHNITSVTRHSKGGVLPDIVERTNYNEGPTVRSCASPATCNLPASTQDANGNVTSYAYLSSGTGQVQRVTGPTVTAQAGGISGNSQTDYCYAQYTGSDGTTMSLLQAVIKQADPSNSRVTSFSYNTANHWSLQTIAVDPASTWVPPAAAGGACTSTTKAGALGLVTTVTSDGVGNLSSIDGPMAGSADTTNYIFDAKRRLTTVAAPLSSLTRYCYDLDGNLLSTNRARVTTTDPNAGTAASGQCPNPFSTTAWQSETRTYAATNDLLTVADAEGNTTQYAYDADGRRQVVQDPDGRQTATIYDAAGEVTMTWRGGSGWINSSGNPSGSWPTSWSPASYTGTGPVRYASYCNGTDCYTPNGKRKYVIDADNNITQYQYDGQDRLRFTFFPDPTSGSLCTPAAGDGASPSCTGMQTYEQSVYDSVGNRISFRSRKGDVTGYHFDTMNRQDVKSPAAQGAVTFGLNLLEDKYQVSKAAMGSNPAHTTVYAYDSAGRILSETNDGNPVTHQYDTLVSADDNGGKRTRTTWPDGYYVTYQYDALGRMVDVRENSTSTNELAYYTYDPLSRRSALCLGGGTTTNCESGTWTNQDSYGYEPDGELNSLTGLFNGTNVTLSFGRNHSSQITSITASDAFYLPTPALNVTTTYISNTLNQYTSINGQTSSYDLNGNLLTWFPSDGQHTYTYDSENRLASAAVGGSTVPTIGYDYDGLGRRVSKTVSGVSTSYLLDGDEELGEYSGSTLLRRYVMGPNVDDRIVRAEGSAVTSPTKNYYHRNHQGSVIGMSDASGNILQRLSYDEWGNLSSESSPTGEPFRYSGRRYDPETGLYYYRARYYAPQIGRFLQTDPVGYKDDLNLYSYVGNDPLDKTDPLGLWICDMREHESQCMQIASGLGRARAAEQNMKNGKERTQLQAVLKLWGSYGDKGVNVKFASKLDDNAAGANTTLAKDGTSVDITFNSSKLSAMTGNQRAAEIAHEGQHGVDALEVARAGDLARLSSHSYVSSTELKAYRLQSAVDEALGTESYLWSPDMSDRVREGRIYENARESVLSDCAAWGPGCTYP